MRYILPIGVVVADARHPAPSDAVAETVRRIRADVRGNDMAVLTPERHVTVILQPDEMAPSSSSTMTSEYGCRALRCT